MIREEEFSTQNSGRRRKAHFRTKPKKRKDVSTGQCDKCGIVLDYEYISIHAKSCKGTVRDGTIQCLYEDCARIFYHKRKLLNHLSEAHDFEVQEEAFLTFSSVKEFEDWKASEEESTYSYYSQRKGSVNNVKFYYCQRDGPLKSHSNLKVVRRQNKKGRMRTGIKCLAFIRAKYHKNGSVSVNYVPTHTHPVTPSDLKHIPLRPQESNKINELLGQGETPEEIVRSLIENFEESNSIRKRTDFPTLLLRIRERGRKIRIALREDKDENSSLTILMNRLLIEGYCPIILLRTRELPIEIGPVEHIDCDMNHTLLIGIQTEKQVELLKMHEGAICADWFQISKEYFVLYLVIPNEFDKGSPVGFCISDRMNDDVVTCFASALRKNVGELKINCVISGDNPVLFNALKKGFRSELECYICAWDVQRLFHKKLEPGTYDVIKKVLYELVNASSGSCFDSLLTNLNSLLKGRGANFIEFLNIYLKKSYQWAKWGRYHITNVDTNLMCESVHNFLKISCLQNLIARRLDDLVVGILKMDQLLEQKRSQKKSIEDSVNCKHARGMSITHEQIKELVPGKHYTVQSSLYKQQEYKVLQLRENCYNEGCAPVCNSIFCSRLCPHMYYCTCEDFVNICEHIHKVHSLKAVNFKDMCDEEGVEIIELKFVDEMEG